MPPTGRGRSRQDRLPRSSGGSREWRSASLDVLSSTWLARPRAPTALEGNGIIPLNPVSVYRASAALHRHGFRRSARLLKTLNFLVFHAIIPPELVAGANFELGHHGLGVVIHPRTVIGDDVHLYHGVTLAADVPLDDERCLRLGDRVRVGAGAILLGPISVGDGARIGAGSVVTADVEAGAVVVGVPARPLPAGARDS